MYLIYLFNKTPLKGNIFYIELPTDFICDKVKYMVLNLNNSLYGKTKAPRLWYAKLKEGLSKRGLKKNDTDNCLFNLKKLVYIAYIDDYIFWDFSQADTEEVLK